MEEELQDPAFLKALAKARGRAVSPVSDSGDEDNEEGEQDSGEEANGGNQATKKRKRDKPLLLKDLKPTEVRPFQTVMQASCMVALPIIRDQP